MESTKVGRLVREPGISISFEFFPPKTSAGEDELAATVRSLASRKPRFVSVTYGAGGSTREGTRRVCKRIIGETGLTVMAHLTCIGATKDDIAVLLDDYRAMGVNSILAMRGDLPPGMAFVPASQGGLEHASSLVSFIRGRYDFSVGVAVHPEGHPESSGIAVDIAHLREKVDAGGEFGVTQMFFDNSRFYGFRERMARARIDLPLVVGVMPVINFTKISSFAASCKAYMPPELVRRFDGVPEDGQFDVGIDYAVMQMRDLIANGVTAFHIYTLNRAETATALLDRLGKV